MYAVYGVMKVNVQEAFAIKFVVNQYIFVVYKLYITQNTHMKPF